MNPEIDLQDEFQTRPTFEITTIEIERDFFLKLVAEAAKIKIPPFIEKEMNGRDGEIFGVETLDVFYSGKISWWSEYPKEWKGLAEWFEKMMKVLETKFSNS